MEPEPFDVSDLILAATHNNITHWGTMHVHPTDHNSEARGYDSWLDAYVVSSDAPELWTFEGSYLDAFDDADDVDDVRTFSVDMGSDAPIQFNTNLNGSRIWAEHDINVWTVHAPDMDSDATRYWITPIYQPLDEGTYQQLVARVADIGGSFVHTPGWSEQCINAVLGAWTKAFTGIDTTYKYQPYTDTIAVPDWYSELARSVDKYNNTDAPLVRRYSRMCGEPVVTGNELPGEVGRSCMNSTSLDASHACELHSDAGMLPDSI